MWDRGSSDLGLEPRVRNPHGGAMTLQMETNTTRAEELVALAASCGPVLREHATALALSMHHHVTAFTAWRWRRDLPGAEPTLKRVAGGETVLVSTGGGDFTHPRGTAVKVDGGWRVSGRKQFASQSPVGSVMSTMFTYEDPERGRRVLNLAVPFGEGVTVHDTWNTMGMRGTASNDVTV